MTKLIYHPLIAILVTILAIFTVFSLLKRTQKTEVSTQNIENLENEVKIMSGEVMDLEEKIIETESEEYKEKIVRNELLLQKPGEIVVQLPDAQTEKEVIIEKKDESKPIEQWIKLFNF
ncbi:MAG: septum formation initiator family protein [Pseudomonadales bacterium]|nr:septum formation initiator family protein [Pseudomonadales bacterium]